jgi:hypothetical protein
VGVIDKREIQVRPEFEKFAFQSEQLAQCPGTEIRLEDQRARHNTTILCCSDSGPKFCDIWVSDNFNAHRKYGVFFCGGRYTNETGLDENTFLSGSPHFQVKENEVSEITRETAFPPNRTCVLSTNCF